MHFQIIFLINLEVSKKLQQRMQTNMEQQSRGEETQTLAVPHFLIVDAVRLANSVQGRLPLAALTPEVVVRGKCAVDVPLDHLLLRRRL